MLTHLDLPDLFFDKLRLSPPQEARSFAQALERRLLPSAADIKDSENDDYDDGDGEGAAAKFLRRFKWSLQWLWKLRRGEAHALDLWLKFKMEIIHGCNTEYLRSVAYRDANLESGKIQYE